VVRARSFGSVAEAYERARPGYPPEAALWITGEPPLRVVDLGAGTGKLTRALARLGHDVVAVEPLEEMLDQLRTNVPGVDALTGSAEQIPLGDESADAVVAAQAFHWFDEAVALPEIARVLRPGGVIGLIWNTRDDGEPWVVRLAELTADNVDWNEEEVAAPLVASPHFHEVEWRTFRNVQRVDRATLVDLVASRSYAATLAPLERSRLLESVGTFFEEVAGGGEELELPYRVYAFRATRL
jgi:SAM-dependent methyltransferase